jgi:hypothetical protein
MQVENDYDKEVYDGDIGFVEEVDSACTSVRQGALNVRTWPEAEAMITRTATGSRGAPVATGHEGRWRKLTHSRPEPVYVSSQNELS